MIEVKNAVMRFDDKNALDGVSLTIPEGCAYGLLGSNGAGKSTLLRALSGIYRLSSGELFIDGEPVYDNAKVKERVFFINDETVQFNTMTLTEMKQYYKSFYGTFSEELWQKLYSALNLPLKKRLNTFSKGMKRQAAVEKHSPKLYDEIPLSLEEIFIYEMEVLGYDSSKLGK